MIIIKILLGLIGLSLVVVVHEAGHFIAARWSGITVEAFSIGWGKILFARKWKGTEFRISLFPLGGYCKMQGEQAMIQAWESKARTLDSEEGDMYGALWWKRIIVSLSGPFMNLIFASLIFLSISLIGYNIYYYPSRIVLASEYSDRKDYPADKSGLMTGDLVTSVNGKEIVRFDQLQEAIVLNADSEITLTVDRNGRIMALSVRPELNKETGAGYLGIYPWISPRVRSISEDSDFAGSGLLPDDVITNVNGRPVEHALQISSLLNEGKITSVTVLRKGSRVELSLPGDISVTRAGLQFDYLTTRTETGNLIHSVADGFTETLKTVENSLKGFTLLFKGIDLQSAVSGPLRITYMTGDLAFSGFNNGISEGLLSFFRFIALINIALFIMNLLPIPVLDGGQILLFLAEGLSGRKPNPSLLYRYQMIGTIIVFALIIFATMNDILFFSRN